jgi:hypothetical protein
MFKQALGGWRYCELPWHCNFSLFFCQLTISSSREEANKEANEEANDKDDNESNKESNHKANNESNEEAEEEAANENDNFIMVQPPAKKPAAVGDDEVTWLPLCFDKNIQPNAMIATSTSLTCRALLMERKGPTRPALRRMEQQDKAFTNSHQINTFLKDEYVHAFSDHHSVKEDILESGCQGHERQNCNLLKI